MSSGAKSKNENTRPCKFFFFFKESLNSWFRINYATIIFGWYDIPVSELRLDNHKSLQKQKKANKKQRTWCTHLKKKMALGTSKDQ